jgi:hypothetical protein
MRRLVSAALAALVFASASAGPAADGPGSTRHGAPAAVASNLTGAGIGKPSSGGGIVTVSGPRCPNGGVPCGKPVFPRGASITGRSRAATEILSPQG